jgi:hypothetical protein
MAGIGNKIKDALSPGHRQDESYTQGHVDTTSSKHLLTQPNTYPNEGAAGTGNRIGSNTAMTGTHTAGVGHMGATGATAGVAHNVTGNTVCETRTFTEVEDRPIMRERVERIIEHRPVEKQFVVETRPVGEREIADGVHYESAGVREYEVDRVAGSKCPTTTGAGAGSHTVL